MPYRASPNDEGLAFLQRGGRGGRGRGQGGRGGQSDKSDSGTRASGGADDVSTITGWTGGDTIKTYSRGESHCFNCGSTSHWADECPQLSREQQSQLHMALEAQGENEKETEEGHQLLHVTLAQGGALPDNRAYLDGCSTVTAFKSDKYLRNIKPVNGGVRINCNTGAMVTNKRGTYGGLKVWYFPDGIANIFSMHELEKKYRITYDSWMGYYVVHTPRGEVRFHKHEQGLPYIDLEKLNKAATIMLLQQGEVALEREADEAALVQTVRGNYGGFTKREVLKAKEARRGQAMLGNPREANYKGMVSNNLITNCPVSSLDVTNASAIFGPDLPSHRGKTVRRAPAPVVGDYVAVPGVVHANVGQKLLFCYLVRVF